MPVKPTPNADAIALNKAWRKEHQQNAIKDVHHDVIAAEKKPVIHPMTPAKTGETPAECVGCPVHKQCRAIMKLWYQHTPRPELVRAWCQLIDSHTALMTCMKARQPLTKIPPRWEK